MASILVLVLALSCPLVARAEDVPVTGKADARLAAFDRLMLSFVKQHDVPGAVLAIGRGGRIVYARGFGYADVARRRPVEPDALFRICSITKPFTATAILQLQERGKRRLDDHPFRMLGFGPHGLKTWKTRSQERLPARCVFRLPRRRLHVLLPLCQKRWKPRPTGSARSDCSWFSFAAPPRRFAPRVRKA